MRKLTSLLAVVAVVAAASPALAHVTVQPNESTPGAFARFVVRVPNERSDASTTKVEVQFPDLFFVSFMDVPGWQRTVEMRQLDEPAEVFGEEVTEVVGTVTWSGGEIQPGEFMEFGFSARMPDEATTLEFPAIQTYDSGEVVRWIGPPDAEEPAARVNVLDIGASEDQGELAVLANLRSQVGTVEDQPDTTLPLVLSIIGIVLGGVALVISLASRKRA
jgi:uncharacterized protein YcnI